MLFCALLFCLHDMIEYFRIIVLSIYIYALVFFQVNSVRLPRHVADRRLFSGTALIEFSTEEDAEKVLKQNLVYGGIELELKSK